jgi:6-phospho-beta-glucosidase
MLEDQLKQLKQGETRADVIKRLEQELFEIYQNPALYEKPKQLEQRGGAYYSEAAVQLISSIYNHTKDIQIVNTRNNGIIPFLPDEAAIEVPCVISSDGATPLSLSKPLPPAVRGLLQVVKAYEELTIEAAVNGDYHSALHALTIHPLVGTSALAKSILDDLLSAHQKYLPQFS